ncbi:MAG TPA: hypothetical protein VMV59_08425 [Candidatus Dormibacteraeota bacterium]|nr:hypothetical protein [Candidatus Dormibacteraeota bacterium]
MILPDMFMRMASTELPTVGTQLDSVILWVGDKTRENPGTRFALSEQESVECAATVGAADHKGFSYLVNSLGTAGLLDSDAFIMNTPVTVLTPRGWDRYEELKRMVPNSRIAFMAMPFGNSEIERAFQDCFFLAARRAGFTLRKVTHGQPAGVIDDQIRVAIRVARFAIADLTGGNQGAYWEAGFAEGLGKPVIYTCEDAEFKKQKTHFDTNHCLTVPWTLSDLNSAQDRLVATIRATLPESAVLED